VVTGDNKGIVYEKKIFQILKEKKILDGEPAAGAGPGTDMTFLHRGKKYKLEVKNNICGPDYGQKRLVPSREGGKWLWSWSIDEPITQYYTQANVLGYLDSKRIVPNKHNKPDSEITLADKKADLKNFEDTTFKISSDAFSKFYEGKADYLQVGNGYGFYHLVDDVACLGTQRFEGDFILRFRVKTHASKPVFKYSFFAVLKCIGANKKSRFNIEESRAQEFPPIVP